MKPDWRPEMPLISQWRHFFFYRFVMMFNDHTPFRIAIFVNYVLISRKRSFGHAIAKEDSRYTGWLYRWMDDVIWTVCDVDLW